MAIELSTPLHTPIDYRSSQTSAVQPVAASLPAYSREKLTTRNETHANLWKIALREIPYGLGAALSENDCFFDAFAQALPEAKWQACPHSDSLSRIKWLRTCCSAAANALNQTDPHHNWIRTWDTWGTSDVSYATYLAHIHHARHEVNHSTIKDTDILRGDPDIDGRLLCAHFKVRLHIMGWDEVTEKIVHKIVSYDSDNPIDSVEPAEVGYSDPALVHLAHYKDHFVPLLIAGDKALSYQETKKKEDIKKAPKKSSDGAEEYLTEMYSYDPTLNIDEIGEEDEKGSVLNWEEHEKTDLKREWPSPRDRAPKSPEPLAAFARFLPDLTQTPLTVAQQASEEKSRGLIEDIRDCLKQLVNKNFEVYATYTLQLGEYEKPNRCLTQDDVVVLRKMRDDLRALPELSHEIEKDIYAPL